MRKRWGIKLKATRSTHVSLVEGVGQKDAVASGRSIVGLFLSNELRAVGVLLDRDEGLGT